MTYLERKNPLGARRLVNRAAVAILIVLATACDSTPDMPVPTASDGKDVLANMIDTKYGVGIASVAEFRELDGKPILYGTSVYYVLEYEAKVEFPEGISASFEHKSNDDKFSFRGSTIPRIVDQEKLVFAGKGWITFSLSEEGWHAPDGNIYQHMPP